MSVILEHEIRDPVAGLIRLTEEERQLLDAEPFQRLRRIKQLALADLVYPGATHSRFTHSLGTLSLAETMWQSLQYSKRVPEGELNNDSSRRIVRLSALMHDLGHGPFSHVAEHALETLTDKGTLPAGNIHKIHERITAEIIRTHPDIAAILDGETRNSVVENLDVQLKTRSFKRDLVSSGLDSDKIDYIQRDALHAGVGYGAFDLPKLIDSLTVIDTGDENYLGIVEDGRYVVDQLIQAKWHMTQQVYAHRIRIVTDAMLVRGIEAAHAEGNEEIVSIFSYLPENKEYLDGYLRSDDESIFRAIIDGSDPKNLSHDIFQRLKSRKLYKEYAVQSASKFETPDFNKNTRIHRLVENADLRTEAEEKIAQILSIDPREVIVLQKRIKNPAFAEPDQLDPEVIPVLRKSGETVMLTFFADIDLPSLQSDIHGVDRIHVIAPSDDNQHLDPTITAKVEEALYD